MIFFSLCNANKIISGLRSWLIHEFDLHSHTANAVSSSLAYGTEKGEQQKSSAVWRVQVSSRSLNPAPTGWNMALQAINGRMHELESSKQSKRWAATSCDECVYSTEAIHVSPCAIITECERETQRLTALETETIGRAACARRVHFTFRDRDSHYINEREWVYVCSIIYSNRALRKATTARQPFQISLTNVQWI